MPLNNRTQHLLYKLVGYLRDSINSKIFAWNDIHTEYSLPEIAEVDVGYRDVLTGLRFYPALLVAESGRNCSEPYFTTYTLNFCIAHHNDDIDALQREGASLLDCFEDVIREDTTLGGNVLDISNITPEVSVVSGTYVAAIGITATVDLGSFDGMGGED